MDEWEQDDNGNYFLPGTCDLDPNDPRNYFLGDPDHSGNDGGDEWSQDDDGNYYLT